MPKRWVGKNVEITLVAALAFILILAAPVAMTTMAYAANDGSPMVDPVGPANVSDNPSDSNNGSPPSDNNPPPQDKQCDSLECKTPPPKEGKPTPFDCNGGLIDDKGNCIVDGKPPFDCNGGLIDDKGNCISNTQGPDESCIFDPSQKKCAPDDQANCPPGFGHNSKDQCFPTHKCPPGFAREDNDESGVCKKIPTK